MSSSEELKQLSDSLFEPELASEVKSEIDSASPLPSQPKILLPGQEDRVTRSFWTAYLADEFYKSLIPGKLTGRLSVRWDGMDQFVYTPTQMTL